MKRIHQITIAAGVAGLMWFGFSAQQTLRGQELVEYEYSDIGVPHAECSFFTPKREQILKSGLNADILAMTQRSELTSSVAAALPRSVLPPRSRAARGNSYEAGSIDDRVFSRVNAEGIAPAPMTTDTEFLRRVTLDLTGRVPTVQEVIEFVADPSGDKRGRAIDRLLATPQWVDQWTMFFGDLFRNTVLTAQVNRYPDGRDAFHLYLKMHSHRTCPTTKWPARFCPPAVRTTGITRPRRIPQPPEGGRRARARWYVVVNASEFRDRRGRPIELEYSLNTDTGNRPTREPADANGATVVDPVYPFGAGGTPSGGESRREALGRLLTEDIQFSRAIVNYIWKQFFGRGIVEPPDQFDLGRLDPDNPPPEPWSIQPSHPRLLQDLAESFAENDFDLKWLMREIANSRAYQLSSRYEGKWNAGDEPLFARHQARRLDAEAIHDALITSSGIFQPYFTSRSLGPIIFAKQFQDVQFIPRAPRRLRDRATEEANFTFAAFEMLEAYLRGDREETPRSSEVTIPQALHSMNSPLVLDRVKASRQDGALAAALNEDNPTTVGLLYLLVLSRYPTADEVAAGVALLGSGDRAQQAEDLMWSLYNKADFIFNY